MLNEKIISMLGLARRAGKLSMGHDAVVEAIKKNQAKLLIFCSDVSARLIDELEKTLKASNSNISSHQLDVTINEIHFLLGYKAGVITVDDENFSRQIDKLIRQEEHVNDN